MDSHERFDAINASQHAQQQRQRLGCVVIAANATVRLSLCVQ